ncbi:MAG TPA: aldo/keto reductase [Clostridiaceae bacterium]
MKYTKLGKSDITISSITHGCMELGGGRWKVMEREHNIQLLRTALEHGITTFDTAEGYGGGNSEIIVGEALKGRRQNCIIATKVLKEHLHAADVRKAAEGSLKRLGTDYIDLLYIHWPNVNIPLEETLREFEKLKEEGKIRAIGVSNFDLALMKQAISITQIDALEPEYNLLQRDIESGVLEFCASNKISVLSYNSVAKGILTGAFHFKGATLDPEDFRNEKPLFSDKNMKIELPLLNLMRDIADAHNVAISQTAAAWVLAQNGMSSAIIGTQNLNHFIENIDAINLKLTDVEMEELDKTSQGVISKLV